jgi:hypothetical protein
MSDLTSYYKIFQDLNLVVELHIGILDIPNYIAFKEKLEKNPEFKPNMNFLLDYKSVDFETSTSDLNKFADYIKSKSKILGNRKIAVITNTPNQVVSTTIYKSIIEGSNHPYEIFSTNENALNWLNINKNSFEKVINAIDQLKNS